MLVWQLGYSLPVSHSGSGTSSKDTHAGPHVPCPRELGDEAQDTGTPLTWTNSEHAALTHEGPTGPVQ